MEWLTAHADGLATDCPSQPERRHGNKIGPVGGGRRPGLPSDRIDDPLVSYLRSITRIPVLDAPSELVSELTGRPRRLAGADQAPPARLIGLQAVRGRKALFCSLIESDNVAGLETRADLTEAWRKAIWNARRVTLARSRK
jgi:hypothetical protein